MVISNGAVSNRQPVQCAGVVCDRERLTKAQVKRAVADRRRAQQVVESDAALAVIASRVSVGGSGGGVNVVELFARTKLPRISPMA